MTDDLVNQDLDVGKGNDCWDLAAAQQLPSYVLLFLAIFISSCHCLKPTLMIVI